MEREAVASKAVMSASVIGDDAGGDVDELAIAGAGAGPLGEDWHPARMQNTDDENCSVMYCTCHTSGSSMVQLWSMNNTASILDTSSDAANPAVRKASSSCWGADDAARGARVDSEIRWSNSASVILSTPFRL